MWLKCAEDIVLNTKHVQYFIAGMDQKSTAWLVLAQPQQLLVCKVDTQKEAQKRIDELSDLLDGEVFPAPPPRSAVQQQQRKVNQA